MNEFLASLGFFVIGFFAVMLVVGILGAIVSVGKFIYHLLFD